MQLVEIGNLSWWYDLIGKKCQFSNKYLLSNGQFLNRQTLILLDIDIIDKIHIPVHVYVYKFTFINTGTGINSIKNCKDW